MNTDNTRSNGKGKVKATLEEEEAAQQARQDRESPKGSSELQAEHKRVIAAPRQRTALGRKPLFRN